MEQMANRVYKTWYGAGGGGGMVGVGGVFTARQRPQFSVRCRARTTGCVSVVPRTSAVGGCCLACPELAAKNAVCKVVAGLRKVRRGAVHMMLCRVRQHSHSGLVHMVAGQQTSHARHE